MIRGVIFDFDGLLVDTESIWYEAFKEILAEVHQAEIDLTNYSKCIGTGNEVLVQYFEELVQDKIDFGNIEKLAYERFKLRMQKPVLRAGVKDYLDEAKKMNLTIGLASSSSRSWVCEYLEKLKIFDYFDVVNTRDEVSHVKPDPELYIKTLKECRLSPGDAIAFEDSLNGLTAAKSAGIYCVIVPNEVTRHLSFKIHDDIMNSMGEKTLRQVIERVGQKA
jgi:putative hydrolase of the HAD superfamily